MTIQILFFDKVSGKTETKIHLDNTRIDKIVKELLFDNILDPNVHEINVINHQTINIFTAHRHVKAGAISIQIPSYIVID